MKNVALHNLGCKVNGYEMDVMQQELQKNGYNIVPFTDKADIYIINTCTVTNIADRKSRQMLHKAKKENPDAVVVAVGCYVETDQGMIKKDPCIDIAVGNDRKTHIVEILEKYFEDNTKKKDDSKSLDGFASDRIDSIKTYDQPGLEHQPGHTRAYIKIQDGCNQFCSYCIIPYARGRVRSRSIEDIMDEAERLSDEGCREIVLTGIHISSFGIDRGGSELMELVQKLNAVAGIQRIRLGSLEPRICTPENVRIFASLEKLCPHFHLSLQSGCDQTLKRMNRHYTCEEYMDGLKMLRSVYDRPAITTDVIVGFPGETEEEFAETEEFLRKALFYEMHVFKYSVRHGTVAAELPNQLTERQKAERSSVLLKMTQEQAENYRNSFLGEKLSTLWENTEEHDGVIYMTGHTERYIRTARKLQNNDEASELCGTITTDTAVRMLADDLIEVLNP